MMKNLAWFLVLLILSCTEDPEQQAAPDWHVKPPVPTRDMEVDRRSDLSKPDYRSWEPGTCWPPCSHSQYCHLAEGCAQQGSGVCLERPRSCPKVPSLVCGCDDKTYDNDCVAHTAGTNIQHFGGCPVPPDSGAPLDAGAS